MPKAQRYYVRERVHSVTLEKLAKKHPDKIKEYFADDDGHWLWLHNGWRFEEASTVREDTVKAVLASFGRIYHEPDAE